MAFPTLIRSPKKVEVDNEPNVIETVFEAGYVHKRQKFTKTRKLFKVSYDLLPLADLTALVTHFDAVDQYISFDWTDNENNVFSVFYAKPLNFKRAFPGWYSVDTIELVEQ